MAQFTLSWDNSNVLANTNATAQRALYRKKSVGGAYSSVGFTPANDLAKAVDTVDSPVLDDNCVYEFKVQTICTVNGPTDNDNGVQEHIIFACIEPTVTEEVDGGNKQSKASLDVSGTDITKARFTLRKASDNTVITGPTIVNRVADAIELTSGNLVEGETYYWQIELYATVDGVEVKSSDSNQLGVPCSPYEITISVDDCVAATITSGDNIPDAEVGVAYNRQIVLGGTAPFSLTNIVKPTWMTVNLVGNIIYLTGTPTTPAFNVAVSFDINNCDTDVLNFSETIDVTDVEVEITLINNTASTDVNRFYVDGTNVYSGAVLNPTDQATLTVDVTVAHFYGVRVLGANGEVFEVRVNRAGSTILSQQFTYNGTNMGNFNFTTAIQLQAGDEVEVVDVEGSGGDNNFTVTNNLEGAEIDGVSPAFYLINIGAFPVTFGQNVVGIHGGFTGTITVGIDSGSTGRVRLMVNGVQQDCENVTVGVNNYTLSANFTASDDVEIIADNASC